MKRLSRETTGHADVSVNQLKHGDCVVIRVERARRPSGKSRGRRLKVRVLATRSVQIHVDDAAENDQTMTDARR